MSCQEQTSKCEDYQNKQRDVNQEYHNDKSFKNIKTTKVLFEKALK